MSENYDAIDEEYEAVTSWVDVNPPKPEKKAPEKKGEPRPNPYGSTPSSDQFDNWAGHTVYTKSSGKGPYVLVERCKIATGKKRADGPSITTDGWTALDKKGRTVQLIAADLTREPPPPGRISRAWNGSWNLSSNFLRNACTHSQKLSAHAAPRLKWFGSRLRNSAVSGFRSLAWALATAFKTAGRLAFNFGKIAGFVLSAHGLIIFIGGILLVALLCFTRAVFSGEAVSDGLREFTQTTTGK